MSSLQNSSPKTGSKVDAAQRSPSRVLKFGGAMLADGRGVRAVIEVVRRNLIAGVRPTLVVSALGGVTECLLRLCDQPNKAASPGEFESGDSSQAELLRSVRVRHRSLLSQLGLDSELCDRHLSELKHFLLGLRSPSNAAQRDFVLSFGERMSARIIAAALRYSGFDASAVDSFDLGLVTDANHGAAQPHPDQCQSLRSALLDFPGIPVVTGFLARSDRGDLTTLGRNGSDLTAALIAEALRAERLQFWRPLSGVLSADPNWVPKARPLATLTYDEAEALAMNGAGFLHHGAIAPARRAGVAIELMDSRQVTDSNEAFSAGTVIAGSGWRAECLGLVVQEGADGSGESEGQIHLFLANGEQRTEQIVHSELAGRAQALHKEHVESPT